MMEGDQIAFAVLASLSFAHFLIGGSLFFGVCRQKHPIRGHSMPLVLLAATSVALITIANAVSLTGRVMPCWTRLLFVFNATLLATIAYTARAWRIYIYYTQQLHAEFMNRNSKSFSVSVPIPVPVRGGGCKPTSAFAWYTERRMFGIVLALGIFLTVLVDIPYFAAGDHGELYAKDETDTCTVYDLSVQLVSGALGVAVIFVLYTLYKIRKISDGYTIKSELARCTVWGAICMLIYILPSRYARLFGTQIFMTILGNAVMFHTITWKVFKTFSLDKRSKRREVGEYSSPRKRYTLEEVLSNPTAAAKFKVHMQLEWCVENLLFHEAVARFITLCHSAESTHEARKRRAISIYETFVIEDALRGINISAKTRNPIVARMADVIDNNAEPPRDIFNVADNEIFHLMKTDPFMRFSMYYSYEDAFSEDSIIALSTRSFSSSAPPVPKSDATATLSRSERSIVTAFRGSRGGSSGFLHASSPNLTTLPSKSEREPPQRVVRSPLQSV